MYFSDLQWCCMVSHELGYHHKKIVCIIILGRERNLNYETDVRTTCNDNFYMGYELEKPNLTLPAPCREVQGLSSPETLPYKVSLSMQGNTIFKIF